MIAPHGGVLFQAMGEAPEAPDASLALDPVAQADVHMLAAGAYSPLRGFMNNAERAQVAANMRLLSNLVWPIPITLGAPEPQARRLRVGQTVALTGAQGAPVASLVVEEVYKRDTHAECEQVFGTSDAAHPGVKALLARGPWCVAGPVTAHSLPPGVAPCLSPQQTRATFAARAWHTVVGFQTRNPIHRAHEYLIKCALEMADGLLLHPLVGVTKDDDIPAGVRMDCYTALIEAALPKSRVQLSTLPAPMRYAGPREAVLHALVRQNYGCSHFIVGRDHAGVGNYYGSYDAQKIFSQFDAGDLLITPLFFEHAFFCKPCGQMASAKTCPHGAEGRITLSGTQVRTMLGKGERPPLEFTRPEVADVLMQWIRP